MSKTRYTPKSQDSVLLFLPSDVIEKESEQGYLKKLLVTHIGHYLHITEGHLVKRISNPEYIMIYCIGGKGWMEQEGVYKKISCGDMFFLDINCPHTYGADTEDPWLIYWVHFIGDEVPYFFKLLGITKQSPVLTIGEKPEVISLLDETIMIMSSVSNFANLFYASVCFLKLIGYLIRLKSNDMPANAGCFNLDGVLAFMRKNLRNTLSLKQLAEFANMSCCHFARKFKETAGCAPMEYFNRLKIQEASFMLRTTSLEIKEISNNLSFNNPFYFSEVFKKITGVSPRIYRNLIRSETK